MRLEDLLSPDRIVRLVFKFFCGLLALLLVPTLLANLAASIHLSHDDVLGMLFLLGAASPIAYFVRESRKHRRPVRRTPRGAERTPVLPYGGVK